MSKKAKESWGEMSKKSSKFSPRWMILNIDESKKRKKEVVVHSFSEKRIENPSSEHISKKWKEFSEALAAESARWGIFFYHTKKTLDKSQTNSNWLKRPLKDAQLKYASEDVDYLIEIFTKQKKILSQEDIKNIYEDSDKEINLGNEKLSNLRIRKNKKKFTKKGQEIFIWREVIAENENLPPSFICKDKDVHKLSKLKISDESFTKKEILRILGDSYYVENFLKRFL